jgi:hypothetical protein
MEIFNRDSDSNKLIAAISLAVAAGLILLCAYSVDGIRGTDQYWYVADTQALIRNEPPVSNFRFPGMLLRENTGDPVTNFVHNGPVLHINKYLAKVLGVSATGAWELSNIVWWVASAVILFSVFYSIFPLNMAILAALFYFVTPIVVWQAANFLQEMWLGFLASVFFYFSFNLKQGRWNNWLLLPFVGIGALSHPFFTLCSLYLIGGALIYRLRYVFTLSLLLVLLVAIGVKNNLFPSSFPPDMKSIVTSTIPGKTNLHWQFDDNPIDISAGLIMSKMSEAVKQQFFKPSSAPLTMVANLGMFSVLVLLVLRRGRLNRILCFSLFTLAAWWAMVVLLQNQARYQLLILPTLIACIVLLAERLLRQGVIVASLALGSACFLAADIYLFSKLRNDSDIERERMEFVDKALSGLSKDAKYIVIDENRGLTKLIIFRLSPALGLMVDPRYIQESSLSNAASLFKPDYLITSMAAVPGTFSIEKQTEHMLDNGSAVRLTVYRVLNF